MNYAQRLKGPNNPHWLGGEIEKRCLICGKVFFVIIAKKDSKYCSNECRVLSYKTNSKKWQNNNQEKLLAKKKRRKTYHDAHKLEKFHWKLKKYYNLSPEAYQDLIAKQGNLCAICGCPGAENKGKHPKLCIDHNHITGTVRGLLCSPCNGALGLFNDNTQLLESAIKYLALYGPR